MDDDDDEFVVTFGVVVDVVVVVVGVATFAIGVDDVDVADTIVGGY